MSNLSQETIQQSLAALYMMLVETKNARRLAAYYTPPLKECSNAGETYRLQQEFYYKREAACERAIAELEKALADAKERTS